MATPTSSPSSPGGKIRRVRVAKSEGAWPEELSPALGRYSTELPPADPPHATHANIYHVIVGRVLQRCFHQEHGTWALYWDAGLFGVDPGWWLAETGTAFGDKALLWAEGGSGPESPPAGGWRLRGFLGAEYQDVPLALEELPHSEVEESVRKPARAAATAGGMLEPCFQGALWLCERGLDYLHRTVEDSIEPPRDFEAEANSLRAALARAEAELALAREPLSRNAQIATRLLAGGAGASLLVATFLPWAKLCRERRQAKADEDLKSKAKARVAKAAMSFAEGDAKILLPTVFLAWSRVLVEARRTSSLEQAAKAREAAKAAAMRAGRAMLENNDAGLKSALLTGWVNVHQMSLAERHALHNAKQASKEASMKAAMGLLGQQDVALTAGIFSSWQRCCRLSSSAALKEQKAAEAAAKERQRAICKQAAMNLIGKSDASLIAVTFSSWMQALRHSSAETIETAVKALAESQDDIIRIRAQLSQRELELTQTKEELQRLRKDERKNSRLAEELTEAHEKISELLLSREKAQCLLNDMASGKLNSYSQSRLKEVLSNPDSYATVTSTRKLSASRVRAKSTDKTGRPRSSTGGSEKEVRAQ